MNARRAAHTIGGKVDLDRVEKVIQPRYLSLLERERLRDLHRDGMSIRNIAAELHRSPSTISRELRRNTISARGICPTQPTERRCSDADGRESRSCCPTL